ncbi:MAG: hypothetical protein R3C52_15105 [Hyphomonadaceae bacterium]
MHRAFVASLALLAFSACSRGAPDAPAGGLDSPATTPATLNRTAQRPDKPRLSAEGWGPISIGMTSRQVMDKVGSNDALGEPDPTPSDPCLEYHPEDAPAGLLVMVQYDHVSRITLQAGSSIRTAAGIGVGDSLDAVREALGDRAVVSPHKYDPAPAAYVDVWSQGAPEDLQPGGYVDTPSARGVRYEIGPDGKVAAIHAGGPAIQYVEGCS